MLSQLILENLGDEKEFHIIAYSIGSSFTIEVTNILEKKGKKGRIWIIEGSPLLTELLAKQYNLDNCEESLQNNVCVLALGHLSSKTSKHEV